MECLVLDAGFSPIARISWQRAVVLYIQSKIEIIAEYEDRDIRSVGFSMKMPSIVRFIKALRGRKRAIKFSRENVYLRDNGKCQYCGDRIPRSQSTYDHVIPRVSGGLTRWENVVIACVFCNTAKGGRTPEQAGMKLLSKPIRPKKLNDIDRIHFQWRPGMPSSWKQFMLDHGYWNVALEED